MVVHEDIIKAVAKTASFFPIKSVAYFGSYAEGKQTDKSDLDVLVEFEKPSVSLLLLSAVKLELENNLKIPVDVIHAPLPKNALIKPKKVVQVYGTAGQDFVN